MEWESDTTLRDRRSASDRCLPNWLGRALWYRDNTRVLGSKYVSSTLQCKGADGCTPELEGLYGKCKRQDSSNFIRQYHYSGLYKPHGGHCGGADRDSKTNMGRSHTKQYNDRGTTLERQNKYPSRYPIKNAGQTRMDVVQTHVPVPGLNVGSTHSRQVCFCNVYTTPSVQHTIPRPKWYESRCPSTEGLGNRKQFCKSSYKAFRQGSIHNKSSKSTCYSDSTLVASSDMVQHLETDVSLPACQGVQKSCNPAKPSNTRTATKQKMGDVCLETLWEQGALQQGWSVQAASRLKFGWAQSTTSNYNVYIGKVKLICDKLEEDFPPATTSILAECIMRISSDSDRPLSMINCLLASLTHVYTALRKKDITNDVFIRQLVSGIVKSCTKIPRLKSNIMPLEKFSDFFMKWDNSNIDIKKLRLKCICLLAIVTMLRPSDIAPKAVIVDELGGINNFLFKEDQVIFKNEGGMSIVIHGNKNDSKRHGFIVDVSLVAQW